MRATRWKKIGLTLLVVISLSACGGTMEESDVSENKTDETEHKTAVPSDEPLSDVEFMQMYSDPKAFVGRYVEFYAQIFTPVEKDQQATYLQAYADPVNYDLNTVIFIEDPTLDVKQDDYIFVSGVVYDEFKGANAFGAEITAPAIKAENIKKSNYIEAVSPPIQTVEVNEKIDQSGFVVQVNKLEIAENETRLYVTITNESNTNINVYTYSAKLIQNGKQLEYEPNFDADYPEPQSELLPGVISEGILAFPPIDPDHKQLSFVLDGSSDDWETNIDPFQFDIAWD